MNISSKDVYRTLLKDYPDIMGIEEMSAALGVSTKTAYKLLREGKITAIKWQRSIKKYYENTNLCQVNGK